MHNNVNFVKSEKFDTAQKARMAEFRKCKFSDYRLSLVQSSVRMRLLALVLIDHSLLLMRFTADCSSVLFTITRTLLGISSGKYPQSSQGETGTLLCKDLKKIFHRLRFEDAKSKEVHRARWRSQPKILFWGWQNV